MTHLQQFITLYRSFGIECKVNPRAEGGSYIVFHESNAWGPSDTDTTSEKFDGYNGFYSVIDFDAEGKFTGQWFGE